MIPVWRLWFLTTEALSKADQFVFFFELSLRDCAKKYDQYLHML